MSEPFSDVKFICVDSPAFYKLVDTLTAYIKENHGVKDDPWVDGPTAMKILNVKSKATLQKLRDTDEITFAKTSTKTIVYDTQSLYAYLKKYSNK